MGTIANNDNLYGVAKWIVDPTSGRGTNTTIQAAITAASSGDTVFIRPGTYTENLTLKVGVNLSAFPTDGINGTVTITGKATISTAGTVVISGIRLMTSSDFLLVVSGTVASVVILQNCYLNCSNNTGISFTSSGDGANITMYNCQGNLGTTGIGLYSGNSTQQMLIYNSSFGNTGASVTATTMSAGNVTAWNTEFFCPVSTTSTAAVFFYDCVMDTAAQNATCITTAGSGASTFYNCAFSSGSASAVSIGTGTIANIYNAVVNSTNTNAITGAGTINYSGISFSGSSKKINTTTQVGGLLPGGVAQAPSAGFIGEQLVATVASGAAVTVNTTTATSITSISLTAGIWDVSGIVQFTGMTTSTLGQAYVNTSVGLGTTGDNGVSLPFTSTAVSDVGLTVPSYRYTLTATTTIYLVAYAAYTAGTGKGYGRISGTRVG